MRSDRRTVLLAGLVLLVTAGCATREEWATWAAHPAHFASGDHLIFSVRNAEDAPRVTREDLGRRSEEHTSELQSQSNLVCRLLLEKKKEEPHVSGPDYRHSRPRTRVHLACTAHRTAPARQAQQLDYLCGVRPHALGLQHSVWVLNV